MNLNRSCNTQARLLFEKNEKKRLERKEELKDKLDSFEDLLNESMDESFDFTEKENTIALDDFELWEQKKIRDSKLELMLLFYIFMSDDGKISLKEKKALKKQFSFVKSKLTKSSYKQVLNFDYKVYSVSEIISFVENNSISRDEYDKALDNCVDVCMFGADREEILELLRKL